MAAFRRVQTLKPIELNVRINKRALAAVTGQLSALTGISASPGIVIGPAYVLRWEAPRVPRG